MEQGQCHKDALCSRDHCSLGLLFWNWEVCVPSSRSFGKE